LGLLLLFMVMMMVTALSLSLSLLFGGIGTIFILRQKCQFAITIRTMTVVGFAMALGGLDVGFGGR